MPEEKNWQLSLAYDYRFSNIGIHVHKDGEEGPRFVLPLSTMLDHLHIAPYELAAAQLDEYRGTEGDSDIDTARVRLLEETDWEGKMVLDIGGYDGFAAEIAHKGGASRAICLDNHQYEHYGWADKRKDGVKYIIGDVMDMEPSYPGIWQIDNSSGLYPEIPPPDVIINYNVLYHVKNPWAFLDKCRKIIKPDGEMLLCTLFRYHDGAWMYLYEKRECNNSDETVYFGPSLEALRRLLKATGWDVTQYALAYDRVLYRCKPTAGWQRTHEDT